MSRGAMGEMFDLESLSKCDLLIEEAPAMVALAGVRVFDRSTILAASQSMMPFIPQATWATVCFSTESISQTAFKHLSYTLKK